MCCYSFGVFSIANQSFPKSLQTFEVFATENQSLIVIIIVSLIVNKVVKKRLSESEWSTFSLLTLDLFRRFCHGELKLTFEVITNIT